MRLPWDAVALAYAALALVAALLSGVFNGQNPFVYDHPRIALGATERHLLSSALGLVLAAFVVATTRISLARASWARQLHRDLRPVVVGMRPPTVVMVAILSSLGEELFFRSFLTPILGVGIQALVFGAAHQVRGPSRWVWMCWAGLLGLVLGLLYIMTGSLMGPLIAHALINGMNLTHLRNHTLCMVILDNTIARTAKDLRSSDASCGTLCESDGG